MEIIEYAGWPECIRLSNAHIELIATTRVGPRVLHCAHRGAPNLFREFREQLGCEGGDEWRLYGGHRLWHSPEVKPRTYCPDNDPITYRREGEALILSQPAEPSTAIAKTIEIALDPERPEVRVRHRLHNTGPWDVELAPWALTVMAPGGRAVLPQEPFRSHAEELLPARPLVLWHYTDMADPRWSWGTRFIQLRQDPARSAPQKLGLRNGPGWLAYALGDQLFLKRHSLDPQASYPDLGCSAEVFTNADMLELETLGPLTRLAPGAERIHDEHWLLARMTLGESEDEIERALAPLLANTRRD